MSTDHSSANADITARIEDFCLVAGIDKNHFDRAGMPEAVASFDAFLRGLPKKYHDPKFFFKMLINNFDFVFSLIESVGTAIVSENIELQDRLDEANDLIDGSHERNLKTMAAFAKVHPTYRWSYDGNSETISEDDEDDLPTWKVTIDLGHEKVTTTCDHFEMSTYFAKAQVVTEDPHPEYDGIDAFDVPRDDLQTEEDANFDDSGFEDGDDDDDSGPKPPTNEWDETDRPL